MSFHFADPRVLPALVLLPLFVAGMRRGRRGPVAALCRTGAAAAVLLALAGLRVETTRPAGGTCVVAAIDTSASVQGAAIEAARDFLAGVVPHLGADDLVGSVAFASQAHVVAHPDRPGRSLASLLPTHDPADPANAETDIGAALAAAAPLCPEGKPAALVLFTDGNETTGSALGEAALGGARARIFPILPSPGSLPPATIRRLLVPASAPEHAVVPLAAVVESRAPAPLAAVLKLSAGGELAPPFPLELPTGVSVVGLPHRFHGRGQFPVQAELLLAPGTPRPPGPVNASITVTRPVRVLVVTEHAAPAIATALARRGMEVESVGPAAFAARAGDLGAVHLVVLDDVARAGFTAASLAALARWVGRGGALVAAGGDHLFADPGFGTSPLARVLPVELRVSAPEPKEREPIALYLLIDRSNSMGYSSSNPSVGYGEKMEYAKRAAVAVLDQLGPSDEVGAIAFDSRPYELGALRPVGDSRSELRERIRRLQYGGGTDFKDALDIARRSLVESGLRIRHIILLTDGDTNRHAEDHDELIAGLARGGITVTTIRIGSDTINLELLQSISRATGGEFHHVEHVAALPQLMMRDTRRLIDPTAGLEDVAAHVGVPGTLLAGIAEAELPPVTRWAVTRAKPDAEIRLWLDAAGRHDPLLATWQYGLGRVAVMPVDFQSGALAWPAWNGFAKLWAQIVLWAIPPGLPEESRLDARVLGTATLVRLHPLGDDPGPFALRLSGRREVALRATGRRTFTAVVHGLGPGQYPVRLVSRAGDEPMTLIVPAPGASSRELRTLAPNRALLDRLATLTGGQIGATPDTVLAARAGVAREWIPLDGVLVALALALVLADVAVRRLAQ